MSPHGARQTHCSCHKRSPLGSALSKEAWFSFLNFLLHRRNKFLKYLHENRHTLEYNAGYVSRFAADLVRPSCHALSRRPADVSDLLGAHFPSADPLHARPSHPQFHSLFAHGVCVVQLGDNGNGLKRTFKTQFDTFCRHLESEEDLWAAMISGCFRDLELEAESPRYTINEWWEPNQPILEFYDLLQLWTEAEEEIAGSVCCDGFDVAELAGVRAVLEEAIKVTDDHLDRTIAYHESCTRGVEELQDIQTQWIALGIEFKVPLRMF